MGVPDINAQLVQVDFEVFGHVQGKHRYCILFTFSSQYFYCGLFETLFQWKLFEIREFRALNLIHGNSMLTTFITNTQTFENNSTSEIKRKIRDEIRRIDKWSNHGRARKKAKLCKIKCV